MRKYLALTTLVALAGCVTPQEQLASQKPTTPEIRKNIAAAARDALRDPYSVRDAEISEVMNVTNGTYVCVKANSRNGFGGYVGRQGYTVFLNGSTPVNVVANDMWCKNPQIRYTRFHELENLKNL